MAVQINVKAKVRDKFGKGVNRSLRRSGFTPAILYGRREKALPLCFNTNIFLKSTHGELHENIIFNLEIDGDANKPGEPIQAVIKELQIDPIKDTLVHVDFYEMVKGKLISIEVPLETVGTAKGVKVGGETLEHIMREIFIECLPKNIPTSIKVDITNLDAGEALHIKDLKPPKGITILEDPDKVILTITHGSKETETTEESESSPETK